MSLNKKKSFEKAHMQWYTNGDKQLEAHNKDFMSMKPWERRNGYAQWSVKNDQLESY